MNTYKNLLVIGGAGNLGRAIISNFKESWKVVSIDLKPNTQAHHNILIGGQQSLEERIPKIYTDLESVSKSFDSIMCVAGGWVGGSIKETDIFAQVRLMHEMQVLPTVLSGHLASKYLTPDGLLVLTGAALPFRQPAPGMLAYSLTKTAVHGVALNLAEKEDLPSGSSVVTILPEVIDTPENRKAMPDADFNSWSSPDKIAELLKKWAEGKSRPANGSFAVLKNVNDAIVPEFV